MTASFERSPNAMPWDVMQAMLRWTPSEAAEAFEAHTAYDGILRFPALPAIDPHDPAAWLDRFRQNMPLMPDVPLAGIWSSELARLVDLPPSHRVSQASSYLHKWLRFDNFLSGQASHLDNEVQALSEWCLAGLLACLPMVNLADAQLISSTFENPRCLIRFLHRVTEADAISIDDRKNLVQDLVQSTWSSTDEVKLRLLFQQGWSFPIVVMPDLIEQAMQRHKDDLACLLIEHSSLHELTDFEDMKDLFFAFSKATLMNSEAAAFSYFHEQHTTWPSFMNNMFATQSVIFHNPSALIWLHEHHVDVSLPPAEPYNDGCTSLLEFARDEVDLVRHSHATADRAEKLRNAEQCQTILERVELLAHRQSIGDDALTMDPLRQDRSRL